MSRKFSVNLLTGAEAVVHVTLSDERLAEVAAELGVDDPAKLTLADLSDTITDEAFGLTPTICAQCSGWGNDDVSLSLGDEWNLSDEVDRPVDTSWLEPALRACLDRLIPGHTPIVIGQLVRELHEAAVKHTHAAAARYPAVEEVS